MINIYAFNAVPISNCIAVLCLARDGDFMKDLIGALVKHRSRPEKSVIRQWVAHPEQYGFDVEEEGVGRDEMNVSKIGS
jgi:hypothetical protein